MKILFLLFFVNLSFAQSVDKRFVDVANEFEKHYGPMARREGQVFNFQWRADSPVVNATGVYKDNQWNITVYGGLLKKPGLTVEAFRFILCHELGHIIGGRPYYDYWLKIIVGGPEMYGGSNSGQPDYYAAAVCMKLLLKDQNNTSFNASNVDPSLNSKCIRQFSTIKSQNLCRRIGNAGLEAMSFLKMLTNPNQNLSFNTPSQLVVRYMDDGGHPELQCRLDTILAGSLCGFMPSGAGSYEAEQMNEACSRFPSTRPQCWFKL